MAKIKIGILGFGTVGGGVYKTLKSFDNVEIVKENKLLTVTQGKKVFKIDLIEQRPPKNK